MEIKFSCAALYCHLWPLWLYHIFPRISYVVRFLDNTYWTQNLCYDFIYNFSETFYVLMRIQRDIIKNVHISSCKVAVIHVRFSSNLNFLNRFLKIFESKLSWKYVPWLPSFSLRTDRHRDERTDMTVLTVVCRKCANAPKNKGM